MIVEKDILPVGKFFRTHALKGELNAQSEEYSAEIFDTEAPLIVDMEGIYVPFYVETWRPKGTFGCLIKLEGIDSQERAQEFVNKSIYMRREDVADALDIDIDEVMAESDFIGYKVDVAGIGYIGKVERVDSSTENLLLIVKKDRSEDLIYIPFVEDFIIRIDEDDRDSEEKTIYLDLPDGIIELNE